MSSLDLCGPCLRDNVKNRPNVWCVECEESLCVSCQKAHSLLKTTTCHHLVSCKQLTNETLLGIEKVKLLKCPTHPAEIIDRFCNNHGVLCCEMCLTNEHSSCKDVDLIEVAAKDIKGSNDLLNTNVRLSMALKTLKEIQDKKIENTKQLRTNYSEIKDKIEDVKNKIINKLNEVARKLTAELTILTEKNVSELKDQIEKMGKEIKSVETKQNNLEFISQHGTESHTFVLTHHLKTDLVNIEKQVNTILDESYERVTYYQEVNDFIHSIGEIKLFTDPLEVEYKPFSKTVGQIEEAEIKDICSSTIKSLSLCSEFDLDEENGFVSGMCINVDDLLLLCIRGKDKLLIYTFDGKPSGEIKVDGNPFNVSCIQQTEKAVVALPDISSLQIVDVDLRDAEEVIEMPEKCWSVTSIQDKLIVAGGFTSFYVLDIEGKRLEEISKPENGRTYSLTFADDRFFYCADVDHKNEKVYCITEEGEFVFCCSNSTLKTPTEVVVDPTGSVYISDLDSNNVQRCSPSGHFQDVVLKGSEVTEPRSIAFNKKFTLFALSNNNGRSVYLYEIIH